MHIEEYRDFCLSLDQVTEHFPFDENTLVFKVAGKIFALSNVEKFESINLKCDPEWAVQLREEYPEIRPGYHMNKTHWNTVQIQGTLDDAFIRELIIHSYNRVVDTLPKKKQASIRRPIQS